MIYQLKVKGELDKSWSEWLGNVQITPEKQDDGSVITTMTVDAAFTAGPIRNRAILGDIIHD